MRVGLTGGIASGKSTVGRLMAEAGCTVTDADRLVAELYRPGGEGAAAVARLFGDEMLRQDGSVASERLARVVFADPLARRRLEAEIHPLVGKRFAELAAAATGPLIVFEATLLVDTGGYRNFDALVTVEADPELRVRRAVARGLDEEEARARLAAQTSCEARTAAADFVILNEGTLDQLRERVLEVVAQLERRAAEGVGDRGQGSGVRG
ncbi:MAG: dephospho-CoA kinase [Acidobacteria bacterium]|nr:MAG: dephospho-CoA kinase [Acidobacteriota bacterium]REK10689.1 MAG: dephospho-CoA kinase [Acidobacteriota bacterium]